MDNIQKERSDFYNTRLKRRGNPSSTPLRSSLFIILLLTFVAIAAMQTVQINYLLSDAKATAQDVVELKTSQKTILSAYSIYEQELDGSDAI